MDRTNQKTEKFLAGLFMECAGGINVRTVNPPVNRFYPVDSLSWISNALQAHTARDLYFGVATRNGGGTREDIVSIPALFLDLDFKSLPVERADKLLQEFPFPPSAIINSGNGYHVYWFLKEPLGKEDVPRFEAMLKRLCQHFEGDSASTDASRILRFPGSKNFKYDPPRDVEILILRDDRRYLIEDFEDILPTVKVPERMESRHATKSDQTDALMNCTFMQWCRDHAAEVPEPLWFAMVSNAARIIPGGPDLVHELSRTHPKYTRQETDAKILHVMNGSGPITCQKIKELGFKCERPCIVRAPIGLVHQKVKQAVARQDTGSLAFPDIMTGAAGEYAAVYASALEVPRHFLYIAYLTCLGSIIANKVTLNSEIAPQPRLFTLLLGESADDRKSTALSKTTAFFREALADFQVCLGIGSAEGLQKRLEGNPQLLLCFDEFKQFVSKCKIDGSVLLPCVNTLFESNRYESRTKNYDISLEDVYLCMLAASTVQTYERTWDSSFTDIGFNNRLFLVPGSGEKKFSFPKRIAPAERSWLRTQLGEVLKHAGTVPELDITEDAGALYHEWYMNLERTIHAKRLDTYAMRFMSLLAVNELQREIGVGIIDKVIKLMNWQLEVRKLHDPIDADGQAAKMEERIRRAIRMISMSDRDLKKKVHAERSGIWVYSMAIKNLQSAREIRWDKTVSRWVLT